MSKKYRTSQPIRRRIIHDALSKRGVVTFDEIEKGVQHKTNAANSNRASVKSDVDKWMSDFGHELDPETKNGLRWVKKPEHGGETWKQSKRIALLKLLHEKNEVTAEDVRALDLEEVEPDTDFTPESVREDIEYLKQWTGWFIEEMRDADGNRGWQRVSSLRGIATNTAKAEREIKRRDEKKQMARVAMSLLLGRWHEKNKSTTSPEEIQFARYLGGEQYSCLTFDSIYNLVRRQLADTKKSPDSSPSAQAHLQKTKSNLENFGKASSRSIYLDAASSIDALVDALETVRIPVVATAPHRAQDYELNVDYLEAWTSSRETFSVLGRMDINIRTLILPGEQDPQNEAICSFLARDFVERVNPHFGMSFIGARAIDLENDLLGSDHFSDGDLKRIVMERSSIRVILADSSKFLNSIHFNGCGSLSSLVDIIICDEKPGAFLDKREAQQLREQFGIILLSATELFS